MKTVPPLWWPAEAPALCDVADDLVGRPVDRGDVAATGGLVDGLPSVGRDVLGPAGAVPVAELVAAERVGMPAGRVAPWRLGPRP